MYIEYYDVWYEAEWFKNKLYFIDQRNLEVAVHPDNYPDVDEHTIIEPIIKAP